LRDTASTGIRRRRPLSPIVPYPRSDFDDADLESPSPGETKRTAKKSLLHAVFVLFLWIITLSVTICLLVAVYRGGLRRTMRVLSDAVAALFANVVPSGYSRPAQASRVAP
jgi:hypothetical protein